MTTADSLGYKAYRRSMSLMLVKAVYDVAEHKNIDKVRIHYSVSKGYYCTIEGNIELTQEFLDKVERRMRTMVEKNLPIQKKVCIQTMRLQCLESMGCMTKNDCFIIEGYHV